MFKVTPAAAEQIKAATKQSGAEGMSLRLAASSRPDGSLDYRMGFDEYQDEDIRFNCEGVEIIMEPEYIPLLDQTLLDYVRLQEEEQEQFIFINPKDPNYQAAD
jgi:iron-sulfur cluster assembly protein